ncbi:hypothetical protein BDR05DRAFT_959740, partial [Suillus weaverae]
MQQAAVLICFTTLLLSGFRRLSGAHSWFFELLMEARTGPRFSLSSSGSPDVVKSNAPTAIARVAAGYFASDFC